MEWSLGLLSMLAILGIVAVLVYEGFHHSEQPPSLTVLVEEEKQSPQGRHIRFSVSNDGERAASAVVVGAIERNDNGEVVEKQSVTIDHVPAASSKSGGFYVEEQNDVELSVEGYVDP